MKNKELDNLRSKINNIDDEILSLLSNRSKIVLEIGKHKKDNSVVDLDREQKILDRLSSKLQDLIRKIPLLDFGEKFFNLLKNFKS